MKAKIAAIVAGVLFIGGYVWWWAPPPKQEPGSVVVLRHVGQRLTLARHKGALHPSPERLQREDAALERLKQMAVAGGKSFFLPDAIEAEGRVIVPPALWPKDKEQAQGLAELYCSFIRASSPDAAVTIARQGDGAVLARTKDDGEVEMIGQPVPPSP